MSRLVKYLSPFWVSILLSILLLFGQGITELSLPDYTARIVNVGIQQGGIDTAVPQAVRASTLDKLQLFMDQQQQAQLAAAYRLIDSASPDYNAYLADYPALANEPVYLLRDDVEQTAVDQLSPIMGKAFTAVGGIQQMMDDPATMPDLGQMPDFDPSLLPPGTDLFDLLATLPDNLRAPILEAMNQQFAGMDDSVLVQAAAPAIQAEYTALGMDTVGLQNSYIVSNGAVMLALSLISAACAVIVSLLSARTATGVARNLRHDIFRKVQSFSAADFDKFSISSLITRSTNDITQVQMLVMMLIRLVFYAPILGIGGILKATNTDASMWWIIAVGILALLAIIGVVFVIATPKFKIIQELVDRVNLIVRENLSGMMVIRAFSREKFEEKRFDALNQEVTATNLFINRVMAGIFPLMMLIMNGLTLLIVWVGAHRVAESAIQVGDVLAFMQYGLQVVFAFLMLAILFIILPRAAVSAGRVADVLQTEPVIQDPAVAKPFVPTKSGTVEFRHVSFRYPGAEADVLHDISFVAKPGQTTAVIGSTGSGKSTLIGLIPRFYDVTEGAVLVNGLDVRDVNGPDLRDQIGYIPQTAVLFSGTIDSNLRYADQAASPTAVVAATDIAQATAFINEKPDGLASEISQGGTNVSGGQRQRLSIARALVKQAPIYIFDDSFSALDFKTDAALRRAMRQNMGQSTLIIVAQRISTVRNAEQIIVLDEGKVVGIGTHEELMKSNPVYQDIALSQLGAEELGA